MLYLEVKVKGRTNSWPITGRYFSIGRARTCDLVLDDDNVSRTHAIVTVDGGAIEVADHNSLHGIFVDENRVPRATIKPGESFRIATVAITLREAVTPPPDPRDGAASRDVPIVEAIENGGSTPQPNPMEQPTADPTLDTLANRHDDGVWKQIVDVFTPRATPDELLARVLSLSATTAASNAAALTCRVDGRVIVIAVAGDTSADALFPPPVTEEPPVRLDLSDGYEVVLARPCDANAARVPLLAMGALLRWLATLARPEPSAAASRRAESTSAPRVAPQPYITVSREGARVLQDIDRFAPTGIPVLLSGESGTGKELLARRLHDLSPRCRGPFVAVNCAAIPSELIEAELFGVQKGAATDVAARIGHFARAHGGTLFLDEIADLPMKLQPTLLRALENHEVLPVGGSVPVQIDIRVVTATSRPIDALQNGEGFRHELYYRIAGAVVTIPPLRERPEDILPIAYAFAREEAARMGRTFAGIEREAARALLAHAWEGNVRQLRNAMRGAIALSDGPIIDMNHLPNDVSGGPGNIAVADTILALERPWREAERAFEKLYFTELMARANGSVTEAARLAEISRQHLHVKLVEMGLRRPTTGDPDKDAR